VLLLLSSNNRLVLLLHNRVAAGGWRSYRFILQGQNREERRRDKLTLLAVDELLQGTEELAVNELW
jgi:hypothetical protein